MSNTIDARIVSFTYLSPSLSLSLSTRPLSPFFPTMTGSHSATKMSLEMKVFCFYVLCCGSIFVFAPQMPVEGTWPDLTGASKDTAMIYAQVVGFLFYQLLLVQCPGPRGLQMAMLAMMGGMIYHITVQKVTPPVPVMCGVALVMATTFYSGL